MPNNRRELHRGALRFSTLPTLPAGKTKEEKEALLKKLQAFEITDFPLQEALD